MSKIQSAMCVGCLFAVPLLECKGTMTPCCGRDICNDCFNKTKRCPVCRHDLHPTLTKEDDPWEVDESKVASLNADEPSGSVPQGASTIKEIYLVDDSPYHDISPEDTLVGISLKYGVSVEEIKKTNKMFSSNVQERKKLLIPGKGSKGGPRAKTPNEIIFERRNMLKSFVRQSGADENEGKYYLEEAKFDLEAALAKFNSDVKWEKSHLEETGRTVSPQNT